MSACHSDDESQGVTAVTFHHSGGVRMKMTKEGFHAGWGGEQKSNVFFTQHVYLVKDMYKMYMWLVFYLRSRCRGRPNLGLKDHFELFAELHNLKEIEMIDVKSANVRTKHVTKTTTLTPKYSHVKNVFAGLYAAQYEKLSTFLLPP